VKRQRQQKTPSRSSWLKSKGNESFVLSKRGDERKLQQEEGDPRKPSSSEEKRENFRNSQRGKRGFYFRLIGKRGTAVAVRREEKKGMLLVKCWRELATPRLQLRLLVKRELLVEGDCLASP